LIATMGMALMLSAGVALALEVNCTAGRGCVGTDDPDTLIGSIGNDDIDFRQVADELFGNNEHDWMQGDASAPADSSTDGDDRVFEGPTAIGWSATAGMTCSRAGADATISMP
jgi:hypothetical protein